LLPGSGENAYLPPQSIKAPSSDPGQAVKDASARLGIPEAVLMAIKKVESGGRKPAAIRFEPHHFIGRYRPDLRNRVPWTESGRSGAERVSYTGRETNRAAFMHAFSFDPRAAVASTSFGLFQVMGYNFFSRKAMQEMGRRSDTIWKMQPDGKVPNHIGYNGKRRGRPSVIQLFIDGKKGNDVIGHTTGQQALSSFDGDSTAVSWDLLNVWVNRNSGFVAACNRLDFISMASMYNGKRNRMNYGPKLSRAYASAIA
jgi:hypothetical protein